MKKVLKVIGIILVIITVISIIAYIVYHSFVNKKLDKINYQEIDKTKLDISEIIKNDLNNYRNIALFGLDSRIQEEDESYGLGNRSDCIMIASVNLKTNEVRLFSVYRDTYVKVTGHGLDKINHAYSYGGPELAIATLNRNFDLNITEYVTVNFNAVSNLVDQVGGIDIELTNDELKYINTYIKGTSKNTGKEASLITKSGSNHLNGVQAVAYGRIRYTEGGDYKRAERMRTVLAKTFAKLKDKNPAELNKIADELLPQVYTNISKDEIYKTIPKVANFNIKQSDGWPYTVKGITLNKVWYGVPCTLESNVLELHKKMFPDIDYTVSDTVKDISKQIEEVTGYNEKDGQKK